MEILGSMRCCRSTCTGGPVPLISRSSPTLRSIEADVLKVQRMVIYAACGRSDPVGELARLHHATHQRRNERAVGGPRQPAIDARCPLRGRHDVAVGVDVCQRKGPNPTVESLVWHLEAERYAGLLDDPVPALDARGRVADIVVAQF